jgi:3-oxoacyl-[acyl-carrier protein] reductase
MNKQDPFALVTGGGGGIGLAVVRALLDRGWKVAFCGRDGERLARATADLAGDDPERSKRLLSSTADVSNAGDVRRWVAEACERFGPPSLLINNAGVGAWGEITELAEEDWDRAHAINLKGAFLCTREALPHMRSRGAGGWIINIASVAGKVGFAGSSAYCSSKFGLVGFTESLAREEAPNEIRATAICPGYVETPMVADADVPAKEMIRPEDVAATVLYLLDLGPNVAIREIVMERTGAL